MYLDKAILVMAARLNMLKLKANFMGRYAEDECDLCKEDDNTTQLYSFPKLGQLMKQDIIVGMLQNTCRDLAEDISSAMHRNNSYPSFDQHSYPKNWEESITLTEPAIKYERSRPLNRIAFAMEDVKKKIKGLSMSKVPLPDDTHPREIIELEEEITQHFYKMFRKTANDKKAPQGWKLGNVPPIDMKGLKEEPGNYRPVCLTSVPCKIFELIIVDSIVEHIKKNNHRIDSQHGFRRKRSCVTNLNKDTVLQLYTSLIRTHLDYGVQFWAPSIQRDIARLETVQARAIKLIPTLSTNIDRDVFKEFDAGHRVEDDSLDRRKCKHVSGINDNIIKVLVYTKVIPLRSKHNLALQISEITQQITILANVPDSVAVLINIPEATCFCGGCNAVPLNVKFSDLLNSVMEDMDVNYRDKKLVLCFIIDHIQKPDSILWYWLLAFAAMAVFGTSSARESRKEPSIVVSSLGGNLLGESSTHASSPANQQVKDTKKNDGIDIDYDYFMFGLQKAISEDTKRIEQESDSNGHPRTPKDHNVAYYGDGDPYDPFSVFYDSLFSEMDVEISNDDDQGETAMPEISTESPLHEEVLVPASQLSVSHHKLPLASMRPIQRTGPRYSPPPPPHRRNSSTTPRRYHTPPRRNSSSPHRYQKVPRPKPTMLKPMPPTEASNTSTPMDLSHLKALMPKILDKFGLPKSIAEKLFENEAALQETILQIMKDKTFRSALSMIPKIDIMNSDMSSLLSTLSSLDPTIIMSLLKNADLSKITSLMSNLGIDTSYISGVFNRNGAAAQYSTKDGSDDDSKLIYIPILDTGSVNNVQVFGFIVIMFFLLTTAYAYLEYGAFASPRRDRPVHHPHQMVTNEQVLGYGDTSDIWLPVVEAIEDETPWNPPPPIHILHASPTEPPRPPTLPPRPQTLPPRPYTLPPRPQTLPPRQYTLPPRSAPLPLRQVITAAPKRPTLPPPRPQPVYQPIRRRLRPKIRRRYQERYQQRYQPAKSESPLYLDSQEIRQLTRRRPVYRPVEPIDRLEPVYVDYYDDYYDDNDYLYEDEYDYYEQASYRENGEPTRIGSINYRYYPATKRPEDHPYSYYSFPGPRSSEGTQKTTTPKTTTTTTSTSTTSTTPWPSTRPTSRYADTIRTGQPNFEPLKE
ncbi:uncharacterized protein [Palaemon carinicauda]|uniref:uncharacterized protein n=1 Tax=Palaemon carinicauda TaxID=392227 RepID=UPI0035B67198